MVDVSLGTGCIGGLRRRIERDEVYRMFDTAYELGIRSFDTAAYYGAGRAETLLGDWIEDRHIRREDIFITTKIARHLVTPDAEHPYENMGFIGGDRMSQILDYSLEGALAQAEASRSRLRLDYVDALLIHDIDRQNHGADYEARFAAVAAGAYEALRTLKADGFCREIGLGVNNHESFTDFLDAGLDLDCGVLAGRYTLLEQEALPFLRRAATGGIRIFIAGVFNSGILAGVQSYNYSDVPPDISKQVASITKICARHHVPTGAAALQFAASGPAVAKVVIGPNNVEELRRNLEWLAMPVPPGLWVDLKDEGIIDCLPAGMAKEADNDNIDRLRSPPIFNRD